MNSIDNDREIAEDDRQTICRLMDLLPTVNGDGSEVRKEVLQRYKNEEDETGLLRRRNLPRILQMRLLESQEGAPPHTWMIVLGQTGRYDTAVIEKGDKENEAWRFSAANRETLQVVQEHVNNF